MDRYCLDSKWSRQGRVEHPAIYWFHPNIQFFPVIKRCMHIVYAQSDNNWLFGIGNFSFFLSSFFTLFSFVPSLKILGGGQLLCNPPVYNFLIISMKRNETTFSVISANGSDHKLEKSLSGRLQYSLWICIYIYYYFAATYSFITSLKDPGKRWDLQAPLSNTPSTTKL